MNDRPSMYSSSPGVLPSPQRRHTPPHTHSHGLFPFPKSIFPTLTDCCITQLLPDIPKQCGNLSLLFLCLFQVFQALVRLGIGTAVEVEDEFLGQLCD